VTTPIDKKPNPAGRRESTRAMPYAPPAIGDDIKINKYDTVDWSTSTADTSI